MAYELIFDSCNDLGPSYDKDNGVTIIPLAFEMEGKRYLRYQDDRELSVDQFYKNQCAVSRSTSTSGHSWSKVLYTFSSVQRRM